jgi:hypothetical protein
MAMPVAVTPTPMTVMPSPVTAVPVPVPVMTPAHLFGLELAGLFGAGDGGVHVCRRQPAAVVKRLRRQRRSLYAAGQRGRSGGTSKGDFQKVTAFHDMSLLVDGA